MKYLSVFAICFISFLGADTYEDLVQRGLIARGDKPSLHLGCGENHIAGYVNIDFPLKDRPLHTGAAADIYHDITTLSFPNSSIQKIENHHVFEHFSRSVSLALLCAWQFWLCPGGTVTIETPDFDQGIQRYLKTKAFQEKQVIIRHLFGSHEESWAVHWDGWYKEKFIHVLTSLGFEILSVRCFSWGLLDNVIVTAAKTREMSPDQLRMKARELLKASMVDNSISEHQMWKKWCNDFDGALDKMLK